MGNTAFKTLYNVFNNLTMHLADTAGVTCSLFGSIQTALLNTYESTSSPGGGMHMGDAKHSEPKGFCPSELSDFLILPEYDLGREYCIVAYHGTSSNLVEIRRCVPSECFHWVCIDDRCARCRANFSQREEHQAIYTRSSGGKSGSVPTFKYHAFSYWFCLNCARYGVSDVRNTSRFHTKPQDRMLCPGTASLALPGAAQMFLRRLGLSWLIAVVHTAAWMSTSQGPLCSDLSQWWHLHGHWLLGTRGENQWELWVNGSFALWALHINLNHCVTDVTDGLTDVTIKRTWILWLMCWIWTWCPTRDMLNEDWSKVHRGSVNPDMESRHVSSWTSWTTWICTVLCV